jgi:tryptophanyl-tRNA synthetase
MSLLEPGKKMGKSLGAGHVIELADEPEVIESKIKKAVTATSGGEKAPGAANLLLLLNVFGNKNIYNNFLSAEKNSSIRYGDLKQAVGSAIAEYFYDFRMKRKELLSKKDRIEKVLFSGADKARIVAEKTMKEVRSLVGII